MREQMRKSGFTLVEVLIASAIFAIVLTGSILMSNKSRILAQKNLVKELVICAAQSRLNQILAMTYEDPDLNIKEIGSFYNKHNPAAHGDGVSQIQLGETSAVSFDNKAELVGGKHIYSNNYNRYKPKSGPFPLWDYNNNNWYSGVGPVKADHYLGREVDDCHFDSANSYFKLSDAEISRMTIDNTTNDIADTTFPFGAAKIQNNLYAYALCDDVDDFDGMSYVIYDVFKDVDLLIEVAVRPHYRKDLTNLVATVDRNGVLEDNETTPTGTIFPKSYNYSYPPLWKNVAPFRDMGEISADSITGAGGAGRGNKEAALDYYRDCIYKEIVVTVTWKFSENGVYQTFSMYGMKSVPQDDDHQLILEKTMTFKYDVPD